MQVSKALKQLNASNLNTVPCQFMIKYDIFAALEAPQTLQVFSPKSQQSGQSATHDIMFLYFSALLLAGIVMRNI